MKKTARPCSHATERVDAGITCVLRFSISLWSRRDDKSRTGMPVTAKELPHSVRNAGGTADLFFCLSVLFCRTVFCFLRREGRDSYNADPFEL